MLFLSNQVLRLGALPFPKFPHEAGSNPFTWILNTKVHFSSTLCCIENLTNKQITVSLFKLVLKLLIFF